MSKLTKNQKARIDAAVNVYRTALALADAQHNHNKAIGAALYADTMATVPEPTILTAYKHAEAALAGADDGRDVELSRNARIEHEAAQRAALEAVGKGRIKDPTMDRWHARDLAKAALAEAIGKIVADG